MKKITICLLMLSMLAFVGCDKKEEKEKKADTSYGVISTEELTKNLEDKNTILIDARRTDAFNGWAIEGVKKGGHIKGAVDFDSYWLDLDIKDKEKEIEKVLKQKGIEKDKNIIIYDFNSKDAKKVSEYLKTKGFEKISLYNIKDWIKEDKDLESYPKYQIVASADAFKSIIDKNNDNKPYKVFEVSWGDEAKSYKEGHIKGAVHINTEEIEKGPLWNRLSDKELEEFAKNNGITVDTKVLLYGDDPAGVYRAYSILKYMGVNDMMVLNGGINSWKRLGFELEKNINEKVKVDTFGAKIPQNPNYIIDLEEAKKILADKDNSVLVDIRSFKEYIGETSGYSYIEGKGRPKGAIWGHAGSDASHLEDFRNLDSTMRNLYEIEDMWAKDGITKNKNLSFYCGTGWRAAEVEAYAETKGFEKISLYDGGWNEWSTTKGLPIETGEPK